MKKYHYTHNSSQKLKLLLNIKKNIGTPKKKKCFKEK